MCSFVGGEHVFTNQMWSWEFILTQPTVVWAPHHHITGVAHLQNGRQLIIGISAAVYKGLTKTVNQT